MIIRLPPALNPGAHLLGRYRCNRVGGHSIDGVLFHRPLPTGLFLRRRMVHLRATVRGHGFRDISKGRLRDHLGITMDIMGTLADITMNADVASRLEADGECASVTIE